MKTRGGDDSGTGTEHHEGGLVSDFETGTGDKRDLTVHGRGLEPFGIVEVRAGRAHGIVEKMQARELFFADVAGAGFEQVPDGSDGMSVRIRDLSGRGEHRRGPCGADAGFCTKYALMVFNRLFFQSGFGFPGETDLVAVGP